MFLNIGDTYYGSGGSGGDFQKGLENTQTVQQPRKKHEYLKPGDLVGIPWMLAVELQEEVGICEQIAFGTRHTVSRIRSFTAKKAHEYVFMFSKSSSSKCSLIQQQFA